MAKRADEAGDEALGRDRRDRVAAAVLFEFLSAIFGFVPGPMGIAFVTQYRAAGLHKTIPL